MSEESPGGSVPGDLALGCLWHVLILGVVFALSSMVSYANQAWLPGALLWLYGVGVIVLVALQFARRRAYIALGLILVPVIVALAVGACIAIAGIPGM